MRIKRPELPRPFKPAFSFRVAGRELPVTAVLGLVGTSSIWIVIIVVQPFSRWAGLAWMTLGIAIYYLYKRLRRKDLPAAPRKEDTAG